MEKDNYLYIFLHIPKTGGTTFSQHIEESLKKEEIYSTSKLRYEKVLSKSNPKNRQTLNEVDKNKTKVVLGHATYYGIHKLFPNRIPRYILFLRDPADRLVSSYNFEMRTKKGKNIPFWKWYGAQLKNENIYFLDRKFNGKEGAKANLPKFTLPFFSKIFKSKKVFLFFQKIYEKYLTIFMSSKKLNELRLKNSKTLIDNCWHVGFVSDLDNSLKYIFKEMKISANWTNENVTNSSKNFFRLSELDRERIYKENRYDKVLFDYAKNKLAKLKL